MKVAALDVNGKAVFGSALRITLCKLNVYCSLSVGDVIEGNVGQPDARLFIDGVLQGGGSAFCDFGAVGIGDNKFVYVTTVYGKFGYIVIGGNGLVFRALGDHKLVYRVLVAFKVEKGFFKILDRILIALVTTAKHEKLVADKLDREALIAKVMFVLFEYVTAVFGSAEYDLGSIVKAGGIVVQL